MHPHRRTPRLTLLLLATLLGAGCAATTRPALLRAGEVGAVAEGRMEGLPAAADTGAPAGDVATAAPGVARVPRPEVRHRVLAGQNVYRLSLQYGCEQSALLAANGMRDARALRVGQVLRIPACGHTIAAPPAAAPPALAATGAPAPEEGTAARAQGRLVMTGRERSPQAEPATRGLLSWPLRGVLYGRFGRKGREPHDGIDLAAPAGTPVQVAAPGTVLYAGEQHGYGNIVLVEHAGGLITLYAHNRELRVRTGQPVGAGQVVATVGESGRTSGPHLHFEVRRGGVAVDPLHYLGPPPTSPGS